MGDDEEKKHLTFQLFTALGCRNQENVLVLRKSAGATFELNCVELNKPRKCVSVATKTRHR